MTQPARNTRHRSRARSARFVVGVLAIGAMAAPVAQADTLGPVRAHVHAADRALHKVVSAAPGGSVGGSLGQLRAQLRAAGHDASRLYHHRHGSAGRVRAATAMTKLAAQQNRDVVALTPLLGQISGADQADLAGFIASAVQGREQVLTLLSQLLDQLPSSLQGDVAGVVAQLSTAGTGQVGQLVGAISPVSIACPALDAVNGVVTTVISSVPADLARVQSLLPMLPADAQSQLDAVVNDLPGQLNALLASLKQSFACPPASGATSAPAAGIGSVTQLVQSLLSSFLPAIGAGQTPSPTAILAPVSGLLGQVTSLIPSIGGLLGGGAAGGLLGFL